MGWGVATPGGRGQPCACEEWRCCLRAAAPPRARPASHRDAHALVAGGTTPWGGLEKKGRTPGSPNHGTLTFQIPVVSDLTPESPQTVSWDVSTPSSAGS